MNGTDLEILALKRRVAILQLLFVDAHVRFLSAIESLSPSQARGGTKQQLSQDLHTLDQTMRTQILSATLSDDQRTAEIQALDFAVQAIQSSLDLLLS